MTSEIPHTVSAPGRCSIILWGSKEWASLVDQWEKNPPAMQEPRRCGFDPWVGKIPWRRSWQPTPIFLFGESHG